MRALALILLASAVAGCGGGSAPDAEVAVPSQSGPTATETSREAAVAPRPEPKPKPKPKPCRAGETRPVGSATRAFAAVAQGRTVAYREPRRGGFATFGSRNRNGVPTVFSVLGERLDADCRPEWYRVQLPLKPNGVTGWVRAGDVELAAVDTRILVDLSDRRVTLFDRGRKVLSARAAIGAAATPTPTGRYYVDQRLTTSDPSGPFGPGAIGISAFSNVLTGWTQGGPIAIHGTNRPDLIGQAVSNGCVRVRNDDLRRLFDRTLAGTPVTVRA